MITFCLRYDSILFQDFVSIVIYEFRVVEIPLPNEQSRLEILKIHAQPIAKHGEIGQCIKFIYEIVFLE